MRRKILQAPWLFALLLVGAFVSIGAGSALAQAQDPAINVELVAGGEDYSVQGADLSAAITSAGVALSDVTAIKITSGKVTQADWSWLETTAGAQLTQLDLFEVKEEVKNGVADLTTAKFPFGSARTVRIGNMAKVGDKALSEAANLWEVDLPHTTELGARALEKCAKLELVRLPRIQSFKNMVFDKCARLHMMVLPAKEPLAKVEGLLSSRNGLPEKRYIMFAKEDEQGKLIYLEDSTDEHSTWEEKYSADDGGHSGWYDWDFADFHNVEVAPMANGAVSFSPSKPAYLMSTRAYSRDRIELVYAAKPGFVPAAARITYNVLKNNVPTPVTEDLGAGVFFLFHHPTKLSVTFEAPKNLVATIISAGVTAPVVRSASTLEGLLKDIAPASIARIEITGGAFETEDWDWLKANNAGFTELTHFSTKSMQYVADMPALAEGETYFPAKASLLELDLHGVRHVGQGAFQNLETLEVVRMGTVLSIGQEAFKGCEQLRFFGLGRMPAVVHDKAFTGFSVADAAFMILDENGGQLRNESPKYELSAAKSLYGVDDSQSMWHGIRYGRFYPIEVLPSEHGRVELAEPTRYAVGGDQISLITTADSPYVLSKLELQKYNIDGTNIESGGEEPIVGKMFTMPHRRVQVYAEFALPRSLTVKLDFTDGKSKTVTGGSLEEIMEDYKQRTLIAGMTFTEGTFSDVDWGYLRLQAGKEGGGTKGYINLKRFIIAETMTSVSNPPDLTSSQNYFTTHRQALIEEMSIAKVTRLAKSMFNAVGVEKAFFPDVEEFPNDVFGWSSQLLSLEAPKLKKIGNRAFDGVQQLRSIDLPALEEAGESAFEGCLALESISLPNLRKMGTGMFKECIALTTIRLPKVERIEDEAFYTGDGPCENLVQVYAPSATSIGQKAFTDAAKLRELVLGPVPPTVETTDAFEGTGDENRRIIIVSSTGEMLDGDALTEAINKYKAALDGSVDDMLWYGWRIPSGKLYSIQLAEMQNGTLHVEPFPFAAEGDEVHVEPHADLGYRAASMTYQVEGGEAKPIENGKFVMPKGNVTLNATFEASSITVVFNDEAAVTSRSLKEALGTRNPATISKINITGGEVQRADWIWLHDMSLSKSFKKLVLFTIAPEVASVVSMPDIKSSTLLGYLRAPLAELNLAKVERIGEHAFMDIQSLQTLRLPNTKIVAGESFYISLGLTSIEAPELEEVGERAFLASFSLTRLSLPKVRIIGAGAFDHSRLIYLQKPVPSSLESIDLPLVEEIGAAGFLENVKLTSVVLPNLRKMGAEAFAQAFALQSVSMPKLEVLPPMAFNLCKRLNQLDLPLLKSMGHGAMSYCYAIETLSDTDLPKLESFERDAFARCDNLSSVHLSGVKIISSASFRACKSLASVGFANATELKDSVFIGCSSLFSVQLPKVTKIGRSAFEGCNALTTLTLGATPPAVEAKAFDRSCTSDCAERILILVDENGKRLEGEALEAARQAYYVAPGGDATTKTWHGWKLDVVVYSVEMAEGLEHGRFEGLPMSVKVGSLVRVVARPDKGYGLKEGSLKVFKKGEPATVVTVDGGVFTMPEYDVQISGEFVPAQYYKVEVAEVSGGTIAVDKAEATVGELVKITVTAADGKVCVPGSIKVLRKLDNQYVEVQLEEKDGELRGGSFSMPSSDVKVSAQFDVLKTYYPITLRSTPKGKIITDPSGKAAEGTVVTITAQPDENYTLKEGSLSVKKKSDGNPIDLSNNTFVMPAEEVVIAAEFVGLPYKITFDVSGNGSAALLKGDENQVPFGSRVKFSVNPKRDAELESVVVTKNNEAKEPIEVTLPEGDEKAYSFVMPAIDVTVKVVFKGGSSSNVSQLLAGCRVVENPFTNTLEVVGAESVERYVLFGSTGQMISATTHVGGSSSFRIATGHLRSGLYLLHLYAADGVKTMRLIKQ